MSRCKKLTAIDYPNYLESEQLSPIKHELIDGELFAMTGGSVRHDLIKNNFIAELSQHLKQSPCLVLGSDANLKVRSRRSENGYYPDVMICCDPTDYHELYREKPMIIVEVVSNSSRLTDKTLKKADYFTLPSLQEYVVVEQERKEITIYRRLDDGWEEEICTQGDAVRLTSIAFTCAIEELYLKVEPAS